MSRLPTPYFYLASNLAAGLDGIRRKLTPPPMVDNDPYSDRRPEAAHQPVEAVDILEADTSFPRRSARAS